jgi:scytalone dehydratase
LIASDYLAIRNIAFEWAESYDTKDWERLRKILAPSINLDFRTLRGELHLGITPEQFVTILSDKKLLGDNEMKTQHFLGGSKFECFDDGSVLVDNQIRVAHQRYTDEAMTAVVNKGHAHAHIQHRFRKFEGSWKLEGVTPAIYWTEYDLFGTLHPENT